jgi:peptidyl-prolyl cis-trans isomerase D
MSEGGKQFEVSPMTTGFFKRNGSIPKIGYEPTISNAAFKLSEKNPLPEDTIDTRKGVFVIQFKERKEPEQAEYEKEKTEIKETLLQLKKRMAFDAFLSELKNRSEITVEEGILNE